MASANSLKVKSGSGRSTRDNSFDHVSTIDFNVVKPMAVFEMVPGDNIHLKPEMWMRTQALNVPTFGKMDVICRAFFVPLRLCWSNFYDMYRNAPLKVERGLQYFSYCPRYDMRVFSTAFLNRFKVGDFDSVRVPIDIISGVATRLTFGIYINDSSALTNNDFTVRHQANVVNYRFNPIGKRVFDLINSLGYRFQFFSNYETSTNNGTTANEYFVSLMPILAWLRLFQDWYCPSEFKYLFRPDPLKDKSSIDGTDIEYILDELTWACYIFFNDDMFSMCENAPYRKGNDTTHGISASQTMDQPDSLILDPESSTNNIVKTDAWTGGQINNFGGNSSAGTLDYTTLYNKDWLGRNRSDIDTYSQVFSRMDPYQAGGSLNQQVSAWTIKGVMAMATWLQRNNLLSSRVTEYLNAKFGVTPKSARMQVTEYIGSKVSPIKISDIPCTEGIELARLGAKGTSYNLDDLRYTAEEFGYVIFTTELRPRIGYGQGVDPLVLRTRSSEFFNEEFDSLGFEPVPTECLASGPIVYQSGNAETSNLGASDNRIFGYLPRLWSYKIRHDNLSGDFMLPRFAHAKNDLHSYHLMRSIEGRDLSGFIHNSLSFRYSGLSYYENNYGRIFSNTSQSDLMDHFMLICSFDCYINGLPLALNESWQVNDDHNEREGHLTNIQGSL